MQDGVPHLLHLKIACIHDRVGQENSFYELDLRDRLTYLATHEAPPERTCVCVCVCGKDVKFRVRSEFIEVQGNSEEKGVCWMEMACGCGCPCTPPVLKNCNY